MNLSLAITSLNDVQDIDAARSQTAQLEDVFEHIEKLVAKRFKLRFIYEALVKAGCTLTFGSFKVALTRIRHRLRDLRQPRQAQPAAASSTAARVIQPETRASTPPVAKTTQPVPPAPVSAPTQSTESSELPWWQQPETDRYGVTIGVSPTQIDWTQATEDEREAEEMRFWKEMEKKFVPIGLRAEKQIAHMNKLCGIKTKADAIRELMIKDGLSEPKTEAEARIQRRRANPSI